ncbi:MAG TPA: ATP-binding protein [Candidatus Eisenbacteria bacterium]|nr:ATP-binding protein [Candidatus Eisenbacteria bacterium]
MFPRKNIRPRIVWTFVFIVGLVLAVNITLGGAVNRSQTVLDQELGKRLQGTAHIAALLVEPEHVALLASAEVDSAAADTAFADFTLRMDAQEAADAVRYEWNRLAATSGLSNIVLVDSDRRVLLRLHDPFAFEPEVLLLETGHLTRALIGQSTFSKLYRKDGEYLRSAYAPVMGPEGSVIGAVAVEGGSEAFQPLQQVRNTLYGAAGVLTILVVAIFFGFQRTAEHLSKIEENMRHTDLLASIGQVSAGVAHEIRNPLAVLRGASSRLQKYDQLKPEERKMMLGMIDEEVNRMSAFVQNFLHLSRRPNLEPQEFELRPVLERSLDILRVELDRANVSMSLEWKGENGIHLLGDPLAMHHVFLNLALNARDVMPDGGTLHIRVVEKRDEVRIQFEDTGPGVPKDIRKKVFDAFFTTRAKGTGLGLAFVDRIVSEHGGSVTVGDAPKGGALFEVRLPLEG